MELTKKQEEGLKTIISRYKAGEKYTVISGYAGTGKSTLVRFAIQALEVEEDRVVYAAYTGKAAEVLRKKGNDKACTLHKLLYTSRPTSEGQYLHVPRDSIDADVVVVDEVSMVPMKMINQLFTYDVYIIFLGDPFQLGPVSKEESNDLLIKPHIFLDEIMRQAAESEIIQLTMKIRAGEPFEKFVGNEVQVLNKNELNIGMLTWADAVLVGTNSTRMDINSLVRETLGYSGGPQQGEKMICLNNYWDFPNAQDEVLVNGTTGIVQNVVNSSFYIPNKIYLEKGDKRRVYTYNLDFVPDGGDIFENIHIDKKTLECGKFSISWRPYLKLLSSKKEIKEKAPRQFDFAYALTYWKAQGSEWDNVLVIEENYPFEKLEHQKAIYTACTRAAKKLVLIKK